MNFSNLNDYQATFLNGGKVATRQELIDHQMARQRELAVHVESLLKAHDFDEKRRLLLEKLKKDEKRRRTRQKQQRSYLVQFAMVTRQNFMLRDLLSSAQDPHWNLKNKQ